MWGKKKFLVQTEAVSKKTKFLTTSCHCIYGARIAETTDQLQEFLQ